MQFEIRQKEVEVVRKGSIEWVRDYEMKAYARARVDGGDNTYAFSILTPMQIQDCLDTTHVRASCIQSILLVSVLKFRTR